MLPDRDDQEEFTELLLLTAEDFVCEWCGQSWHSPLKREWLCRRTDEGRVKHWKNWQVCNLCKLCKHVFGCMPYVVGMAEMPDLRDIMAVQPMQEPNAQIYYMDLVYGHDAA